MAFILQNPTAGKQEGVNRDRYWLVSANADKDWERLCQKCSRALPKMLIFDSFWLCIVALFGQNKQLILCAICEQPRKNTPKPDTKFEFPDFLLRLFKSQLVWIFAVLYILTLKYLKMRFNTIILNEIKRKQHVLFWFTKMCVF